MPGPEVGDNNFCGYGFPLHFRERTLLFCSFHTVYLETSLVILIIDLDQN